MGRGRSVQRSARLLDAVLDTTGEFQASQLYALPPFPCLQSAWVRLKMPRSSLDCLNNRFREFYVIELQQLGESWSQLLIAVCSFLI